MWKKILAVLAVLIVGVLGYAATLPDTFRVERSQTMKAPPAVVFEILTDFRQGKDWSPWEKMDPQMKKTFAGPETGVGSSLMWEGNDDVGKGSQKIVIADKPSKIVTELHFMEPFEAHNQGEFLIQPDGKGSSVTWAIGGPQPFVSKVMCVFMDMDALIGKDFESGLLSLKTLAEKKAATASDQ
jgi:uncharacterized protein YndB with AHSA1/START domain